LFVAFGSEAVNLLVTRRVSEDRLAASLTRRVTVLPQIKPARIDSQPIREKMKKRYFREAKGKNPKAYALGFFLGSSRWGRDFGPRAASSICYHIKHSRTLGET